MATFLLDTFALGVKDVFAHSLSDRAFDAYVLRMSFGSPMDPVDPSYARKPRHDLVARARTQGFAPHRDSPQLEPFFGTVKATTCDVEFRFGFDGQPLLIGEMSEMGRLLIGHGDDIAD
jgi:hypothetical protein